MALIRWQNWREKGNKFASTMALLTLLQASFLMISTVESFSPLPRCGLSPSLSFTTRAIWPQRATASARRANSNNGNGSGGDGGKDKGEIPTMDWLTDSLPKEGSNLASGGQASSSSAAADAASDLNYDSPYMEQLKADDVMSDAPIPSTGVSVFDEMMDSQRDQFATELVPIIKGMPKGVDAAQIVTTATKTTFEPVRYLIGLHRRQNTRKEETAIDGDLQDPDTEDDSASTAPRRSDYVMVDVPPYSDELAAKFRRYMGTGSTLSTIIITNREGIHYDESPSVYTIRRADLERWTTAFQDVEIIAYRIDVPRDCQELVTQRLDGNGPFAMCESNVTFVETGRPLHYAEWNHAEVQDFFVKGVTPEKEGGTNATAVEPSDDPYSPENIRIREETKPILAIHTPGHTFGSVSYVFPQLELCCSGYTIPAEDDRRDVNTGVGATGPAMDVRGYITTSKAGITLQVKSATALIDTYVDRFNVILPSRGDPVYLEGDAEEKRESLKEMMDAFEKIGTIYEQLGITSQEDDDM